jgi:tRNA (guanine37-N1)-methyltransferase
MLEEATGLRVPKNHGQKTLELAGQLKLINEQLQITKNHDFVYIPLIEKPSDYGLKILKDSGVSFEIVARSFEKRKREKKSFVEQLEQKLPPSLRASVPRSLDLIGNIAIVEIPPELRKHRETIGKVILGSNRNVHTVLAKAGPVTGTYRTRGFDFVAGERKTETVHKEHGCQYLVDVTKTYFSPRLSNEHKRISSSVKEGETVVDMFAGVGPFAILIAKDHYKVQVYAIDANPDAIEYLRTNVRLNRVTDKVHPILGDAKEVIANEIPGIADRVIMNLPEKAMEFVDAACRVLKTAGGIIHFYSFADASIPLERVKLRFAATVRSSGRRMEKTLGQRIVRETAPHETQIVLDAKII